MNPDAASRRWIRRVAFWLYALAWTLLLIVPDSMTFWGMSEELSDDIVRTAERWDKLIHVVGYFALMTTAGFAYSMPPGGVAPGWLAVACLSHAAAAEIAQWTLGTRIGDFVDWLAGAAGLILASIIIELARRRSHGSSALLREAETGE